VRAILVRERGGPEVLRLDEVPEPEPGPGQARVRIAAAGVNFIDVYHRTGLYPVELPSVPGVEAAGVVDAVGPGVEGVAPGDRVGWVMLRGAYAERAVVPADRLVPLPDAIAPEDAAAVLLQGMTAHYLVRSTRPLTSGDTALVHAAAGGVGLLLVQMAKALGARVLGTVSTEEKAALALEAGADEVVLYESEDFVPAARRFGGGRGVHVVYDSVGRATFDRSLDALRPRGMLVLFGTSSGPVPPVEPGILSSKGSLFLTRPALAHHVAEREELLARAADVLGAVRDGRLRVRVDRTLPLEEAAEAHRLLEGRRTAGKLLLRP
jgi:NADPH2:quinone reductase